MDKYAKAELGAKVYGAEELDVIGVEEHEANCRPSSVDFEGIASENDSLEYDVMWVTLGQLASKDRSTFDLVSEERIDSKDKEGRRWEQVRSVEGAIEVSLAVLSYLLCIFGLLSAVETP